MLVINHPGSFDVALVSSRHQVGVYEKRVDHVPIGQNGVLPPETIKKFDISSRVFLQFMLDQKSRKILFVRINRCLLGIQMPGKF
jgi:hypothetical protein